MKIQVILLLLALILVAQTSAFHLRGSEELHDRIGSRTSSRSGSSGGGGGFFGFVLGPILFIMAFPVIWYNEKKAAVDYRRLQLAKESVQEVNPFVRDQIQNANGQLVHITGDTQTNEYVVDGVSGLRIGNCIKISREVEVKQWRARQQGDQNNRRWEYDLMWCSSNQSMAHDRPNPETNWFINSQLTLCPNVMVGQYLLNDSQKQRLQCRETAQPQMEHAFNIAQRSGRQFPSQPQIISDYIYFPSAPGDIEAPGSLRVKFQYLSNTPISIIARSKFNTFEPYRIDIVDNDGQPDEEVEACGGCCCCMSGCVEFLLHPIKQIDLINQQKLSYQEMIDSQVKSTKTKACIIRVVAYFMMVLGICLLFSPITTLLGYIPLIGGFLKSTVGIIIFIAALIICLPIFLLALAFCWLCFHPKVGIALLVIAAIVTGIVIFLTQTGGGGGAGAEPAKHMAAMFLRSYQ